MHDKHIHLFIPGAPICKEGVRKRRHADQKVGGAAMSNKMVSLLATLWLLRFSAGVTSLDNGKNYTHNIFENST